MPVDTFLALLALFSPIRLVTKFRGAWVAARRRQAAAQILKARAGFGNVNVPLFLRWKYASEPVLERGGKVYPVAVYRATGAQVQSPDKVLSNLDQSFLRAQDFLRSAGYRTLITRVTPRLRDPDLTTFSMRRLHVDGQLGLECALGTYFDALDTCDSLLWELLCTSSSLKSSSVEAFERFDRKLPLRSRLHQRVPNPVRDGAHRSAAIAVSTLIAYFDEGSLKLLMKRRSSTSVAIHAGLLHVVPSFMFQPATGDHSQEFSVTHNFFREYLEELFSSPEPTGEGHWREIYSDPRVAYLQKLIAAGDATLYLSGIAVNLYNLRPEICTLLLIRTDDWCRKHSDSATLDDERFRFNTDEFMSIVELTSERQSGIAYLPYKETDEELLHEVSLRNAGMVPPGAGAFWLGIDLLREVLPKAAQCSKLL